MVQVDTRVLPTSVYCSYCSLLLALLLAETHRKANMKECRQVNDSRKAWNERHNAWLRDRHRYSTPESSILGSAAFSNEISLQSLSLHSDRENKSPSRGTQMSVKTTSRKPVPIWLLNNYDDPNISTEDQKILKLMALRREVALQEEELAFSARNIWDADKHMITKATQEKQKSWNQYITEKRKLERIERMKRRKDMEERTRCEKMAMEMKINEKHERVERKQMEIYNQRRMALSSSGSSETLHRQMKIQQEEMNDLEKTLHINLCEAKEKRSEQLHQCMLFEKFRRIREYSLNRDLRSQAAKDMRDEIHRKLRETQGDNMKKYNMNQTLCEYRVNWALDWKRKILLEKNKMRRQHHSFIISKLKEDDLERESLARQTIQRKDAKLKCLRDAKDMNITKSRINARVTASMRNNIRASYSLSSF